MKQQLLKLALLLSFFLAFSGAAHAQCSSFSFSQVYGQIETCTVGATAVNSGQIVVLNTSGLIVPISSGATGGAFGVAIQSGVTGAQVLIVITGQAQVSVDNACTIGQYVIPSSSIAGNGHCTSSPSTTQWIGTSASLLAAAGAANVQVSPASTGEAGAGGGSTGPIYNPSGFSAVIDASAPTFGIKNTGRFVWDATVPNSSSTITCPNSDCNFLSTDVGLKVFATNATTPGYTAQNTSIVVLPIGTISTVNSAQSITVSTTSTSGAAALCAATGQVGCLLAWGPDETTAINAAFAAATTACGTVIYPGVNAYGTGPTMLFFDAPILSIAGSGGNSGSRATCSQGTEGARTGIQVTGQSYGTTLFVPTPDFNAALCTYGTSTVACNATVWDGLKLENVNFFGAGQSIPTGMTTHYFMEINPIAGGNPAAGNVNMQNVSFMNYGSGSAGMLGCLLFNGGVTVVQNLNEDGCGVKGIVIPGNTTNSTNVTLINVQAVDNYGGNLIINGSTINSGTVVTSYGGVYGFVGHAGSCDIYVNGFASQPATFESFGDFIGYGVTNPNNVEQLGLCVGYTPTGGATVNSVANLHGTIVDIGGGNPTGSNGAYVSNGAGNVLRAINSRFNGTGTGTVKGLAVGGLFVNEGGNTITSYQNFGGTGLVGGADSLQGSCSGTATASTTLGLFNLGENTALTCTATSTSLGDVMDRAKTVLGVTVTATHAGVSGSSGVVTVLKNGSATSITCTIGTGTECDDYAHATTVVMGDVISVQFTTQASEVLAGVHAMLPTAN